MSTTNSSEDAVPSREQVYKTLLRSLRLKKGFGIVFVQCSPAEAMSLIREVGEDLPQKRIGVLKLTEPIDNLYDLVANRSDCHDLNILFIQGLEKSLEPYIKPGYGGEGEYYNLNTVPKILSHLNQRREGFRDNFSNICFVLILPLFAIKFFIRRAPDFFDWSSGVFEFPYKREFIEQFYEQLIQGEYSQYLNLTPEEQTQKVLGFEMLLETEQSPERKANILFEQGNLFFAGQDMISAIASYNQAVKIKSDDPKAWYMLGIALGNLGQFEEAVASYDEAVNIKSDDHQAWYNRGVALGNLGRFEEAVASFDEAVNIKSDLHEAWYNRGIALSDLGRLEEAVASYDQAVKIKSDDHDAWNNRGIALSDLGRLEEAVASYDQAVKIKSDKHEAWYNRGNALSDLGRFEEAVASYDEAVKLKSDYHEVWDNRGYALYKQGKLPDAIKSYDQAIEIKSDDANVWYNRASAYGDLGDVDQAIENLQTAINLDAKYREMAKTDADFDSIRNDVRFQMLIGESGNKIKL
ncbi:tetratricopeptide repeat protein [Scytonema hofmannii FACHB-248]|uniref:Tetratricopeptide repeat protein n=1 Tax=Scytonema hofmannii FACHB-248 TaxID=1842502 RepID=A0ABR8GVW8_9CYAN|nr:tetratricopeptide repeat protein [Scytonema hofmannii]MBD2607216.1 tetratricopeptide repeat protein [Scytonema hofmannii FACHB-248]